MLVKVRITQIEVLSEVLYKTKNEQVNNVYTEVVNSYSWA